MANPEQLLEELIAALLPAVGADSNGGVQYSRELTAPEQTTAAAVIAAHNPAAGTVRRRAITAALALAQTVNGTNVTALTAAQVRSLVILLAAANGWVAPSGANWVVNVTAGALRDVLRD
jgi:hypothetical protein